MYTVIGNPQTRAFRVIWCLEELDVPYELLNLAPRSPEMKAYNPSGKVPALKVGEDVIIDSIAICQFVADRAGKLTYPCGSVERAKMDSFTHLAADEFDHACWVWAKHDRFLPEDQSSEGAKCACSDEWDRALVTLEKRLGDNKYVMGDDFTVPDILFGQCATWAERMCGFAIPDGKVKDYFNRIRRRKGHIKAVKVAYPKA